MYSKELRIGNWLECVARHREEHICFKRVESIEGLIFGSLPSSFCKSIRLTEEILLKSGFEQSGFYWWTSNKSFYLTQYAQNEYGAEFSYHNGTTIIEYTAIESLHNLQNLYFAITGKELKINL